MKRSAILLVLVLYSVLLVGGISYVGMIGPATSTDNSLPRFDGTSGTVLQGSSIIVGDSDDVSGINNLDVGGTIECGSGNVEIVDATGNLVDGAIPSALTRDTEWDSISEINAATADADIIATNSTWTGGDLSGTGLAATVAADSVALTTDTSGNYVATVAAGTGVTVAGADGEGATKTVAATLGVSIESTELGDSQDFGDWATTAAGVAEIDDDSHAHTTTTISGLDVSADLNLTAGDHITLTDDNLDIDDDFLLNTGDTGTGGYDFGGATLEVPNGTAPAFTDAGEIAIDTNSDNSNITHASPIFYDGAATRIIPSIEAYPSVDGYVVSYDSTAKEFTMEAGGAGGATAYDDIGDPDASGSISFGAYTGTYTSSTDGWQGITISNTTADLTSDTSLLNLTFTDTLDNEGIFLKCNDPNNALWGSTALFVVRESGWVCQMRTAAVGHAGLAIYAANNSPSTGTFIDFMSKNGVSQGGITGDGAGGVNYLGFVGAHWTQIVGNTPVRGMVVEFTGNLMEDSAIHAESRICRRRGSHAVYGVYAYALPDDKSITVAGSKKPSLLIQQKIKAVKADREKNRIDEPITDILQPEYVVHVIHAVGTGQVLVSDLGGDIEPGDLLEADGQGYACKQADDIIRTSTLGRAVQVVRWSQEPEPVRMIGCILISG